MSAHRPLKRCRDAHSSSSISTSHSLDGPRRLRHLPKRQTTSPPPSPFSRDKYILRPSLLAHRDSSPYDTDESEAGSDSASETDVELGTALSDIDADLRSERGLPRDRDRDTARGSPDDDSEQVDIGLLASAPDSPSASYTWTRAGDFKFASSYSADTPFPLDFKRKAVDPREYGGGLKKRRIADVDTTDDETKRPREAPLRKKRRHVPQGRRLGQPTKSIMDITAGIIGLKAQSVVMDLDLPLVATSRYIQRCVKARAGPNKRRRSRSDRETAFDPFLTISTPVLPRPTRQTPKPSFSRHLPRRSPTSLRPLRTHFRAKPQQAVALTGSALVAEILARTQQQKRRRSLVRDYNARTFAGEWRAKLARWKTWAELAGHLARQEPQAAMAVDSEAESREEEQVDEQMDLAVPADVDERAVDACLEEETAMDISPQAVFVPRQVRRHGPAIRAQLRARHAQQARNEQALRERGAEQYARVERQARRALQTQEVPAVPAMLTPSPTPSDDGVGSASQHAAVDDMVWCPPTPPISTRQYQLGSPIHLDSERDDAMGVEDLISSPVLIAPPSPALSERTTTSAAVSDPPEYDVTTYPISLPVPPHLRSRPVEPPAAPRSPPQYSRDMLRQYERSPPPPPPYNATTDCHTLVAARFIEDDEEEEREMALRVREAQAEMRRNAATDRRRRRESTAEPEVVGEISRQRMIGAFPSAGNASPLQVRVAELSELDDGEEAIDDLLFASVTREEIIAPRPVLHPGVFFRNSGLQQIDRALGLDEEEEDQVALAAAVEEHLTDLAMRELEDELDDELVEAERLEAEEEQEQVQAGFLSGLGRMWRGVWRS